MNKLNLIVLFIICCINISFAQNREYILDEKVSVVLKNVLNEVKATSNFSTSEECKDKDLSKIDTLSIQNYYKNLIDRALQKENAGNVAMTKDTIFISIILKTNEFEGTITLNIPLNTISNIELINDNKTINIFRNDKKEKVI